MKEGEQPYKGGAYQQNKAQRIRQQLYETLSLHRKVSRKMVFGVLVCHHVVHNSKMQLCDGNLPFVQRAYAFLLNGLQQTLKTAFKNFLGLQTHFHRIKWVSNDSQGHTSRRTCNEIMER